MTHSTTPTAPVQLYIHPASPEVRRIRLTDTQRAVLAQIDLDARASVEEIASAADLRPSTVRHTVERLKDLLALRPCCWTDPYLMGETPYRIFFSIHAGGNKRLNAFLDFLIKIPEVHWVGTLIGYYQVGLHLRASTFEQLRATLDSIDDAFGEMIIQKEYAIISELTFLPTSLITQRRGRQTRISFRASSRRVDLDAADRKLLAHLQGHPLASLSQISRSLGIPTTTLAYRFKNLTHKRVILGFFYSHDERGYGYESYLLLVSVVGLGSKTAERFRHFASQHPRILMFTACTGRWDFEFEVVVSDVRELQAIVDELHSVAGGAVRDILIHAWGEDLKG